MVWLGSFGVRAVHARQVFPSEPDTSSRSRRRRKMRAVCAAVCALALASTALGEDTLGPTASLGAGWQSTPGYFRVPVVAAAQPGATLTGGVGYGFTESQGDAPGSHHRLQGRL